VKAARLSALSVCALTVGHHRKKGSKRYNHRGHAAEVNFIVLMGFCLEEY
jgi:hypothetical protein